MFFDFQNAKHLNHEERYPCPKHFNHGHISSFHPSTGRVPSDLKVSAYLTHVQFVGHFTVTATPTNSYHTLAVNVKDCTQATSVMSTTTDCVCTTVSVCRVCAPESSSF